MIIRWTQNVISEMNLILPTFHWYLILLKLIQNPKTKYYDTDKNQINDIENILSFYKSIYRYLSQNTS